MTSGAGRNAQASGGSVVGFLRALSWFYVAKAIPLSAMFAAPVKLKTAASVLDRLRRREDDPRKDRTARANTLALLGFGKLVLGRVPTWELPPGARAAIPLLPFALPFVIMRDSVRAARKHGQGVRSATGRSVFSQTLEQAELYLRAPALLLLADDTDYYYRKKLYETRQDGGWERSIPNIGALFTLPNVILGVAEADDIFSKEEGAQRLRAASVPTIEILAFVGEGKLECEPADRLAQPIPHDLFAKPVRGRMGRGALAWKFLGGDRYRALHEERELSWRELVDELRALPTRYMLQPRIANHPELARLGGETLMAARVLTYLDPTTRRPAIYPTAYLKIPRAGAIVDNVHVAGARPPLICAIDTQTGELGPGFSLADYTFQDVDAERNVTVRGVKMPRWSEVVDVALAAHRAYLPDGLSIGWDIAVTKDGPLIVEGGHQPGLYEEFYADRFFGDDEQLELLMKLVFVAEEEGLAASAKTLAREAGAPE